jgi:hypothetical protein
VRAHDSDPTTQEGFIARVADAASLSPSEVNINARLIEDLDLDSIALLELIASVVAGPQAREPLFDEFAAQRWDETTVTDFWRQYKKRVVVITSAD